MNKNYPAIAGVQITTDNQGRYNLNALHKASGLGSNKAPAQWLRTQVTQDLITELKKETVHNCIVSSEGRNGGTFAHELLAISYAGWISPKFQLMVNQVFLDYKKGNLKNNSKPIKSYLPEYRQARAIELSVRSLDKVFGNLPNLSEVSKQAIYANAINPIAGSTIIPLPVLESKTYSATEVGEQLGISANKVGRLAKELNLKNKEYGISVLDKSKSSDKQVETFRYYQKAIDVMSEYLADKKSA